MYIPELIVTFSSLFVYALHMHFNLITLKDIARFLMSVKFLMELFDLIVKCCSTYQRTTLL